MWKEIKSYSTIVLRGEGSADSNLLFTTRKSLNRPHIEVTRIKLIEVGLLLE